MTKPKVFITRLIPDKGLDLIKQSCEAEIWPENTPPDRATLLEKVRGVDGILSLLTERIDAEVLEAAGPQLKVISNMAVGFDNIEVPAASARKIPVGNTPDVLTDATADFAFGLMLTAGRRMLEGVRHVHDGKWQTWEPSLLLGVDFAKATLGIIGFGRVGKALARRAAGFDMKVIYYDPIFQPDREQKADSVDLETIFHEADFISLHTPLTPETHHLINAEAFAKMKPNCVLVNTSRGPVIDLDALYIALRDHQIFAAGLDVTDPEPLPPHHPLLSLQNIVVCPHIASASKTTRDKMALMAAKNLLAGLKGNYLPNCVNPEVYAK